MRDFKFYFGEETSDKLYNRVSDGDGIRPIRDPGHRHVPKATTTPSGRPSASDVVAVLRRLDTVDIAAFAARYANHMSNLAQTCWMANATSAAKPNFQIAPEPEPEPRKPCLTHKETVFTFSDGTTKRSCTHDDCGWGQEYGNEGRWRKKHSNGLGIAIPDDIPDAQKPDWDEDNPKELVLLPTKRVPVAGEETEDDINDTIPDVDDAEGEAA